MKKTSRRAREAAEDASFPFEFPGARKMGAPKLKPQNAAQAAYLKAISSCDLVFGLGPAGTGKTYVAAAYAADQIAAQNFERLIITRPAVEAGESIGFLPGELEEKFEPYFGPVRDVLQERLGRSHVEGMLKAGRIVVKPLAYMRGCSFKGSLVMLDEAQNTTPHQMKMFLTRLGEGSKMIVNGDPRQTDVRGLNGLLDAIKRLDGLSSVRVITFTRDDIVRHGLVREIVERYECDADPEPDVYTLPSFVTGD